MEIIETRFTEGSTAVFTCTFTDENGDTVTPTSDITWTVRSADSTQISTGTESAAETVYIVIKGTDLSAPASSGEAQILTLIIETTYDSDLGDDFPLVKIVKFSVENEFGVP